MIFCMCICTCICTIAYFASMQGLQPLGNIQGQLSPLPVPAQQAGTLCTAVGVHESLMQVPSLHDEAPSTQGKQRKDDTVRQTIKPHQHKQRTERQSVDAVRPI